MNKSTTCPELITIYALKILIENEKCLTNIVKPWKNPKTIYKVDLTMENMNPPKISSFYAEFDSIK